MVTITLNIPEETVKQAEAVAATTQRHIEDVLTEWLDRAANEIPVDQLPDAEVRQLAELKLTESQQQELSDLLADQRENQITEAGRVRLNALMRLYQQGMVRKSEALRVAVQRGLMPPLG